MFANRQIIAIRLACVGVLILAVGIWPESQDQTPQERVTGGIYAKDAKPPYGQWGLTSPPAGPTAMPKPTLASPSQADPSVLANGEVVALLDALRQHGIALENPVASHSAFLYPMPGVAYRIGRGGLAVHPFPNREAAEKRANEIPSELARPSLGEWVDQPHFYRCQSTLVLYLGRDAKVMEALEEQCGPPFAGL